MAQLLGTATEQMSLKLGQTLAGLLNASLGNTVEIIVGITALLRSEQAAVLFDINTSFNISLQMNSALCRLR